MFNFDNRSGDASGRKVILDPETGEVDTPPPLDGN
jgi:hypothetical protein